MEELGIGAKAKGYSIMDYQLRLNGLQQEMWHREIDLALYGSSPNYQYLTGTGGLAVGA